MTYDPYNVDRFVAAQNREGTYETALRELINGRKPSESCGSSFQRCGVWEPARRTGPILAANSAAKQKDFANLMIEQRHCACRCHLVQCEQHSGARGRRTEDARKAMTESTSDRLGRLDAACKRNLGDPDLWFAPDGYPNSLALCIVDSIYSTGAHYSSVINVVRRYRDDRQDRGGDASTDGASELAGNIDARGGPDAWAIAIGNRRPTSTSPGAPLKADAIYRLANNLVDAGTDTAEAFRSAVANGRADELKSLWRSTPGQRSGITWEYALMLLGVPGVKADRMVVRYVARALERPTLDMSPVEAAELVRGVAERNDWNVIRTDHAIWRFESGRPVNREGDPVQPEQPDE